MSGNDPLAPLARFARQVPGYARARRVVMPRVRENRILRAVAHKLWVTEVTHDGRGADLTAGNLLAGVGQQNLPVALFVLTGVPATSLAAVVDDIAAIQLTTAGFRPVLVLSTPDFGCARTYGYPAELMPTADGLPLELSDRVGYWERLRRTYGTTIMHEVGPDGLSVMQKSSLLALSAPSGQE